MNRNSPEYSDAICVSEEMLIGAKAAAKMCGVSLSTWRKLNSMGKIPEGIRLGRRLLWNRLELERWVDAHCPSREEWRALEKISAMDIKKGLSR